ncbi:solute carrier family 4 member 11-like [Ptychodera flava]|uniref:solute carrier family 4 member 11-like n=1 Tax=Ptychodera flava TaxID=63121 RepID=UPI00396A6175
MADSSGGIDNKGLQIEMDDVTDEVAPYPTGNDVTLNFQGSRSRNPSITDLAFYASQVQTKRERENNGDKLRGWDLLREIVDGMRVIKRSTLIYTKREKLRMKDFAKERRTGQDVTNLLNDAEIFLDLPETNLHDVIKNMLNSMLPEDSEVSTSDCIKKLFADDLCLLPSNMVQGNVYHGDNVYWEETWMCIFTSINTLTRHRYAIARLRQHVNLGPGASEIKFVVLVVAPSEEKETKSAKETSLTFATLFSDIEFRWKLSEAKNQKQFKMAIDERYSDLADHKVRNLLMRKISMDAAGASPFLEADPGPGCGFARGIRGDIKRRLPHYFSDYIDGFRNANEIKKLITTIVFLYFCCLLNTLALGALNDKNTEGAFGVKEAMVSLAIAGLVYAVIGGQIMVILLTSAPLAIYAKLIKEMSVDGGYEFFSFYAIVGFISSGLVFLFALFDVSKYMKYSTRMVDEVFALFISASFLKDAILDTADDFTENYNCLWDGTLDEPCIVFNDTMANLTGSACECVPCAPEESILFLFMVLAVPTLGLILHYFRNSPYLGKTVRVVLLADQALAITTIWWAFVHSFFFRHIEVEPWSYTEAGVFRVPDFANSGLDASGYITAALLGFFHSLLIFVDHSIAESVASAPENKLKKGSAFHWDLVVVALLNALSSLCGWPMVHGKLPHTPMHVKNLADTEERVVQGYVVTTIVRTTETRQSTLISHILLALSLLMLPYPLQYIPQSVLDGIYVFLAIRAFSDNQFFERMLLLITDQTAYPPNHYVRRVPQKQMHFFTFLEMLCLIIVCVIGLAYEPLVKMWFPIVLLLLIPLRQLLFPKLIDDDYLHVLDAH